MTSQPQDDGDLCQRLVVRHDFLACRQLGSTRRQGVSVHWRFLLMKYSVWHNPLCKEGGGRRGVHGSGKMFEDFSQTFRRICLYPAGADWAVGWKSRYDQITLTFQTGMDAVHGDDLTVHPSLYVCAKIDGLSRIPWTTGGQSSLPLSVMVIDNACTVLTTGCA